MLLVSLFTGALGFIFRLFVELCCVIVIFRGVKSIYTSRTAILTSAKNYLSNRKGVIVVVEDKNTIKEFVFNLLSIIIAFNILF